MKIHIYYRHASVNHIGRDRPSWFNYERCFTNLLTTIEKYDNVNLTLAMDGEVDGDFCSNYLNRFTLFQTHHKSSLLSWRDLLPYVKEQPMDEGDVIYWVENDYMHLPGWVDKVVELYSTYSGLEYVSLYDHNDKYIHPMYGDLVSKVVTTPTHHWRSTPSTCGTYMQSRKIFEEDYDIWVNAVGDHNTFLYLNETSSRHVLTPIPGLATHCMEGLMSPTINWQTVI